MVVGLWTYVVCVSMSAWDCRGFRFGEASYHISAGPATTDYFHLTGFALYTYIHVQRYMQWLFKSLKTIISSCMLCIKTRIFPHREHNLPTFYAQRINAFQGSIRYLF
jgi:hypothetical protein